MAQPSSIGSRQEFFGNKDGVGLDESTANNKVYVSPPNEIVVRTGPKTGAGSRSSVTYRVKYKTVHDPATGVTEVYQQDYNLLGQAQTIQGGESGRLIATRNADGTYEPSAYAKSSGFDQAITNAIANDPNVVASLEAQRKYTIQSALKTENNGVEVSPVKLAEALDADPTTVTPPVQTEEPVTGGNDRPPPEDGSDGSSNAISFTTNGAIQGNSSNQAELKEDIVYPSARAQAVLSDYIRFSALEYKPASVSTSTFGVGYSENKVIGKSVYLPIQGSISDANGVGWNEDTLSPLQIAGASIAEGAITGGAEGGINALSSAIDKIGTFSGDAKKYIVKSATQAAIGANIFPRTERAIFNPNVELLFNGPQLRAFTFQFKLTPRSGDEEDNVKKIIKFFKINMSAKTTNSQLFLKAPNVFRIEYLYRDGQHPGINLIKDCALQNFSVDYTPDGTYMTLPKGGMFSYAITMSFMELLPIYSSDYDEGAAANHPIGY